MAIRSGAGTGVIVSLVVFVLTTVFMLILSIVFYAGKADAIEQMSVAQDDLARYVKPQQRNNDQYKGFEQAAAAQGQSVAAHLNSRYEDLMRYVNGDATIGLDQLKADLSRHDVATDGVVRHVLESTGRDLRSSQTEIEGLNRRLADREAELAEKQAQVDRMKQDHQQQIEQVSREIVSYRESVDTYRDDLAQTIATMNRSVEDLKAEHRDRVADLEDDVDGANQEIVLLRARVDEYEALLNDMRIKGKDPSQLVDGNVIDVEPSNEQVFIDRGRRDRIVLGMTFEIYDDASAIRIDPRSGLLPRGKASLQVVRVDETTSTCKLTRTVPGRPVTRNDVIANAVYDPKYRFKFLVHGKFDVDGDGRPSEAEAEYLRSLVVDWGGEVVLADELPGDLDFLVLGEMPPRPAPLRSNATDAQTRIYLAQRAAHQKYQELFDRASEAQIPIMNANRFFVLLGHTDR